MTHSDEMNEVPLAFGPPLIQVAGVLDVDEALMLARAGATHIGFPLHLDVHAEDVSEAEAGEIIAQLPGSVIPVLITYLDRAVDLAESMDRLGVDTVQAHGPLDPEQAALLKARKPGCFLIKSLVVGRGGGEDLADQARRLAPHVDAFITDTFDPASGASGATGLVHDWDVSRDLARMLEREHGCPLILAGGLKPGNVAEAVRRVRPAGVDAHTGLEGPDGRKDQTLVEGFVRATRSAWIASGSRAFWPGGGRHF